MCLEGLRRRYGPFVDISLNETRQTFNVTLRRVRANIVAVGK